MSVTQWDGIPRNYLSTLPYRDTTLITTLTGSVPNPFQGLIPDLGNSGLNGANTSVRQLITEFPHFPVADSTSFSSGVTMRNGNTGSSYFHSLTYAWENGCRRACRWLPPMPGRNSWNGTRG